MKSLKALLERDGGGGRRSRFAKSDTEQSVKASGIAFEEIPKESSSHKNTPQRACASRFMEQQKLQHARLCLRPSYLQCWFNEVP